ncbi:MAG: ABC transporter permease subunit [Treponema sp.]|jgi:L-cystine transport system permease protein|nr:ABC transporter permease subunit [Treponema sp.]
MDVDVRFLLHTIVAAAAAVPRSLGIAFAAIGIGLILGFPIALTRFYRVRALAAFFKLAVTVVKGLPVILLYLAFFTIMAKRPGVPAEFSAVMAISIGATVSISEIFRGALESIEKSQFDAAASIGHSPAAAFIRIIAPQLIPAALPVMSGVVIQTIKAVPVAVIIGVTDILNTAISEAVINYRYLEAYFAAAIIFWAIFIAVEQLFALIEKRFQKKMRKAVV